jgi:cob(I)alamin adenosyltransferase
MRLYTKTGDGGETGLPAGIRVPKDDLRVAVCGDLDEANSAIGVAASLCSDEELVSDLRALQFSLFALAAEIAEGAAGAGDSPRISAETVAALEACIDRWQAVLPPIRSFVLPGGCSAAAAAHLARAVCRRAERALVSLTQREPVGAHALPCINRASDLLFVLARAANARAGTDDALWPGTGTG